MTDNIMYYPAIVLMIVEACALVFLICAWFRDKRGLEMVIDCCPYCKHPTPWIVRIHPLRGIFTKYYIECRSCHCCGKTKIGKRRAIKAWNRRAEDGK